MDSDFSPPLCVELVVLLLLLISSSPLTLLSCPLLLKVLTGGWSVGDASYTDLSLRRVFGLSAGIGRKPIPSRVVVEPLNRPVNKKKILVYGVRTGKQNIERICLENTNYKHWCLFHTFMLLFRHIMPSDCKLVSIKIFLKYKSYFTIGREQLCSLNCCTATALRLQDNSFYAVCVTAICINMFTLHENLKVHSSN